MTLRARRWLRALLVAGVLLFAALLAVWFYLDTIAKLGVERGATAALGVPTALDSMSLRLFRGECELRGLKVSNPQGFDTTHFLTLKSGKVAVAPASLLQPKVVVPEIVLSGIDLNMEMKNGKANYQAILDQIKKIQQQDSGSGQAGGEGKHFVINKLVIEDVTVHANLLPLGGKATTVKIALDRIELKDLGTDTPSGVTLAQVTTEVTRAILQSVAGKGAGILPPEMLPDLLSGLTGVASLGKDTLDSVGGAVKDVGKAVKDVGKDVGKVGKDLGKGLGGLFGGKKEKEKQPAPEEPASK